MYVALGTDSFAVSPQKDLTKEGQKSVRASSATKGDNSSKTLKPSTATATATATAPANLKVNSVKINPQGTNKKNISSGAATEKVKDQVNDQVKDQVNEQKPQLKKTTMKLKNVKLVVEDYQDKSAEKLVPVDPVVLRQKPKVVPIAEVKRESLRLPQVTGTENEQLKKVAKEGVAEIEEKKPILVVSQIAEEDASSVVTGVDPRLGSFSPFHPPPPGSFPSTLNKRETLTVGSQNSELLPLPPVVGPGMVSEPSLPQTSASYSIKDFSGNIPRATPVGLAAGSPQGNPNSPRPSLPSYYTDSESSALLHMATDNKALDGASSSVFGQMW